MMKLAHRLKVTLVGKTYSMHDLIQGAIAVKAAPRVHAVIAAECIRLGIGRNDYRNVIMKEYNKIRDAIKWKDAPGAVFCPKWDHMKSMVYSELSKGQNSALHTQKPDWSRGDEGCVWTEVDLYIAERLIAYRKHLPSTYQAHLKNIATRVAMVDELMPDLGAAIRVPIDLQDGTKLLLVVMADGALVYRRAKIKMAMSQTEVITACSSGRV